MDGLTSFLANNYLWFLIIGIVLILALIGYIVDAKNAAPEKLKTMKIKGNDVVNDKTEILETLPDELTNNKTTTDTELNKEDVDALQK